MPLGPLLALVAAEPSEDLGGMIRTIGEELCPSTRTVDDHLSNVYAELDLDGRQALATVPELAVGRESPRADAGSDRR